MNQKGSNKGNKVYVGMSGGVDSSVSAYLLKKQGYDVTGVFIKVWQPDTTDCGWKDERRDAMRVCAVLDIPFITVDFSQQYKKEVVDYMVDEYKQGRTPNPDVMCNRHVKFGSFLNYALSNGVEYVATGHYAQNICNTETGFYELKEGADAAKDQSYFLWTLTQTDLQHILFPVGHLQKPEVRELAHKAKLPVFDKKDSQGVCFIGHLDMKSFLKEYIETKPGDVLDIHGTVVGSHEGAELYTIGERHGFVLKKTTDSSEPHFIIKKDVQHNTITVASKSQYLDFKTLEKIIPSKVKLHKTSFSQGIHEYVGKKIECRIRYRQERQLCCITHVQHSEYEIEFDVPQKGMAEGQSVVLYDGDTCLGGGILHV